MFTKHTFSRFIDRALLYAAPALMAFAVVYWSGRLALIALIVMVVGIVREVASDMRDGDEHEMRQLRCERDAERQKAARYERLYHQYRRGGRRVHDLQTELESKADRLAELTKQNDELKHGNRELQIELRATELQNAQLQKQAGNSESPQDVAELKSELLGALKRVEHEREERAAMKDALDDIAVERNATKRQLQEAGHEYAKLEKQYADLKTNHDLLTDHHASQTKALKDRIGELQKHSSKMHYELSRARDNRVRERHDHDQKLNAQAEVVERLQRELDQCQKAREDQRTIYHQDVDKLNANVADLKNVLKNVRHDLAQSEAVRRDQRKTYETNMHKLYDEIDKLKGQNK